MRRVALLALAIALAATCLAAATAVASAPRGDGLPRHLTVPAPRVGDRAHYEVSHEIVNGSWLLMPFSVRGVDAEWRAPEEATDAWGASHAAAPLAMRADYEWYDGSYGSSVYQVADYEPAAWRAVAVTNHEEFPEQRQPSGLSVFQGPQEARAWFETRMLQILDGPCGFAGDLATKGASPGELVHLGGRCGRETLTDGAGDAFRMAAIDPVGDIPAVRFDSVDHPLVHVWVNPGIPFPVKVRDDFVDLLDAGKTGCCIHDWTLTAYEPGGSPYVPAAPQGSRSSFPLAPATQGLPDASGVQHGFPIAEALQVLLARDEDASAFVRRHPDAYVGESNAWHSKDQFGRVAWHHLLVLTDGHGAVSRHVYQDDQPTSAPTALTDPSSLADPTAPRIRIESWDNGLPGDVTGLYPEPSQGPRQLPRVADVAAAFLAASNDTIRSKPYGWGVLSACFGHCDHPLSFVRVNVIELPSTTVLSPADALQPRNIASAALNVRDDGSIVSVAKRTQTLEARSLLPIGAAPVERASRPLPQAPAGLPYAPLAAVAGGLALAALAAVLLWPAKVGAGGTGAVGLFSRIEDSRLLQHAGRAALVQAIEAEPGIHLRELARRTGHADGALRHHLRKLEAAGLVVARPLGGYHCYFVPSHAAQAGLVGSAAARSPGAQQVLLAVRSGVTGVRAIAQRTGLAPSTVSEHLARLRESGALAAQPAPTEAD